MRRILVQSCTSSCIYKAMITTFNSSLVLRQVWPHSEVKNQRHCNLVLAKGLCPLLRLLLELSAVYLQVAFVEYRNCLLCVSSYQSLIQLGTAVTYSHIQPHGID